MASDEGMNENKIENENEFIDELGLEGGEGMSETPPDGMGVPGAPPENISYKVPPIIKDTPTTLQELNEYAATMPASVTEGQPPIEGFRDPVGIENATPPPSAPIARVPRDLAKPGPAPISKLQIAQQANVALANAQPVNNDNMAGQQALESALLQSNVGNQMPVSPSPGEPAQVWGTQRQPAPVSSAPQPVPNPQGAQIAAQIAALQHQQQQIQAQEISARHTAEQQRQLAIQQQMPPMQPPPPMQPQYGQGYAYQPQPGFIPYNPDNFPIGAKFVVNNTLFEVIRHNVHFTKIVLRRA